MGHQPDWASLPAELWQQVAEHMGGGISCCLFPSTALPILDTRGHSLAWLRAIFTLSRVSRCLHQALLGPSAAPLWQDLSFHSMRLPDEGQSASLTRYSFPVHLLPGCCKPLSQPCAAYPASAWVLTALWFRAV